MNRRLIKLGLLLIAGAILNVAVAWGCVLALEANHRPRHGGGAIEEQREGEKVKWEFMYWDRGCVYIVWWLSTTMPIERVPFQPRPIWSIPPELTPDQLDEYHGWHFVELAAGWPALSMKSEGGCSGPFAYRKGSFVNVGIQVGEIIQWRRQTVLPLLPLWPGFAINTIFYAAILWVVFFVPGKLRRTLRRRRGLCPACAYQIGASPVCTECGAAIERRLNYGAASRGAP
jgi:hypothetical protein